MQSREVIDWNMSDAVLKTINDKITEAETWIKIYNDYNLCFETLQWIYSRIWRAIDKDNQDMHKTMQVLETKITNIKRQHQMMELKRWHNNRIKLRKMSEVEWELRDLIQKYARNIIALMDDNNMLFSRSKKEISVQGKEVLGGSY